MRVYNKKVNRICSSSCFLMPKAFDGDLKTVEVFRNGLLQEKDDDEYENDFSIINNIIIFYDKIEMSEKVIIHYNKK